MLVKFDPKKWPDPQVIWISRNEENDLYMYRVVVHFVRFRGETQDEKGTLIDLPYYRRMVNVEKCYGRDEMGGTRWDFPEYRKEINNIIYQNIEPGTSKRVLNDISYYLNSMEDISCYILHALADALGIPERIEIPDKK